MPLLIATIVEWSGIPTFAKLMPHIFDRVRITAGDRHEGREGEGGGGGGRETEGKYAIVRAG